MVKRQFHLPTSDEEGPDPDCLFGVEWNVGGRQSLRRTRPQMTLWIRFNWPAKALVSWNVGASDGADGSNRTDRLRLLPWAASRQMDFKWEIGSISMSVSWKSYAQTDSMGWSDGGDRDSMNWTGFNVLLLLTHPIIFILTGTWSVPHPYLTNAFLFSLSQFPPEYQGWSQR
jgi:hypothetical protein